MAITKKMILDHIAQLTGIKSEYITLMKFEGTYHWSGKAGAVFLRTNTEIKNLKDYKLKQWLESFNFFSKEALKYSNFNNLNEMIESIDWVV